MTDPTDLIARADEVLKWLSPGKPVQFHPSYCDEARGTSPQFWDTSHHLSLIRPDGTRYRIAEFRHADDAAFDQQARQLVPALRDALAAALTRAEAMEAENADLKTSVVAFCGPFAAKYAQDFGFPEGHLHPTHYDILEKAGARMDDFTRAALTGEPQR